MYLSTARSESLGYVSKSRDNRCNGVGSRDLIAIGHVFFGCDGRRRKPLPGIPLVSRETPPFVPVNFLSRDNIDRSHRPTEILEYIVSLLLRWLCTILLCTTMRCASESLFSRDVKYTSDCDSCSPISSLLLLAAGSVSTPRLRYCPNQPP